MNTLFIIPARGGSKGIKGKNIKSLGGKPLIHYSIDIARTFTSDENICLTSDSDEIISCAKALGLSVPFIRPAELSNDTAGSYEVLLHALEFYESKGKNYQWVCLLQPTSPFRKPAHIKEAISLLNDSLDMVVSVCESSLNPYFNLFEEDKDGFLRRSKESNCVRRQDCPPVYEYNGSIYIINTNSLKKYSSFREFQKIKKYVMEDLYSVDLDTPMDWAYAEFLIEKSYLKV